MKRQDILVKPKIVDKKKVLINFDLGEEAIGIFLDYSIRFYKKSIDKIICSSQFFISLVFFSPSSINRFICCLSC